MARYGLVAATFAGSFALSAMAYADALPPLPAPAPSASPGPAAGPAPQPSRAMAPRATASGVAVMAVPGATDAAWPLAQSVYATPSIRPYGVDEAHARVLCGEAPPSDASQELHDMSDAAAAVRGEDAASRAILGDLARKLNVRALVVVHFEADRPVARVFLADTQAFDAASYEPDATPGPVAWTAATASLARAFGGPAPAGEAPATAPVSAPPLATHEEPALSNNPPPPKAFYESGWFWGALGAAAFAGGAVFFATRDNGASTIHLDMQVPH
jgi:hypothetical protein